MAQKRLAFHALVTLGLILILSNTGTASLALARPMAAVSSPHGTLGAAGPSVVCNFSKASSTPVLALGAFGAWDSDDVWDPSVLKESSTSYQMWYTGTDAAGDENIGYATSTDGASWTKHGAAPVLAAGGGWESNLVFKPSVVFDGVQYDMWYVGEDASGTDRIGYATSPDGITWTKHTGNPVLDVDAEGTWDDHGVGGPSVLKVGSTYQMFFTGSNGVTTRIGHATSSDGVTWSKDPENPVISNGSPGSWSWTKAYAPALVAVGGRYMLFYSGGALPEIGETGYAASSDLSTWRPAGPVLVVGAPGAFDSQLADRTAVVVNGASFQMWYSGQAPGGEYQIGYGTGQFCPASPQAYLPLVDNAAPSCVAFYTDDFTDPNSGWPTNSGTNSQVGYTSGEYQILISSPDFPRSVTPAANATDFTAAVTANRQNASTGSYGIAFGISADGVVTTSYEYLISGDQYRLSRVDDSVVTVLKDWTTSAFINSGTSQNRMEVVRAGSGISLYANSHFLTTLTDATFIGLRRVGLVAVSNTDVPQDARFNDFAMYPSNCLE